MLAKITAGLASLNLSLWLTGGIMLFLAIGSFASGGEGNGINDVALFSWLREAPFAISWWLWITLALIALLAVNAVFCSVASLRVKSGSGRFLVVIAPQVMHAGFLLIVIAHLLSAYGGFKQPLQAREGTVITFPGGGSLVVGPIATTIGMRGMITDYRADIRTAGTGEGRSATLRANHPFFFQGYGLYLKYAEPYPFPVAYLEIHREPGGGAALAGALLFTVGNLVLLSVRKGKEQRRPDTLQ
jgi:hypothetical protein